MRCPYCGKNSSKVKDSKGAKGKVRRNRKCLECGKSFITYECAEEIIKAVIKKDGRRELFNEQKLQQSIILACTKTSVFNQVSEIVEQIADRMNILTSDFGNEIPSAKIAEGVMAELKKRNALAYFRYAFDFYKSFEELEAECILPVET